MAKKRANGEGSIRKRSDGRWEGRYTVGYNVKTGKRIIKNVLGKTQAECKAKLSAAIEAVKGIDVGRADEYTVATAKKSDGTQEAAGENPAAVLLPEGDEQT